jgi:ABC-type transporter MlaC component
MAARRTVAGLLLVVAVGATVPRTAGADEVADARADGARRFVDSAMTDTVAALAVPAASTAERNARLRAVVERYVDVGALGRGSVGVFWQGAAAAQQDGFLAEFKNFLLVSYVGSMARAGQLSFAPATVIGADRQHALVRTAVRASDGPATPVLITVACADDGSYRITDVAAAGISLRTLLVADFGAFLRRNGGRLEALIVSLHNKIAAGAPD